MAEHDDSTAMTATTNWDKDTNIDKTHEAELVQDSDYSTVLGPPPLLV